MRKQQVGFNQRIQLDWLERTAFSFLAGNRRSAIQTDLEEYLRDKISIGGESKSSNRRKAITILLRIWVSVPENLEELRNEALEHLSRLPEPEHLLLHWGMTMAVYPFFGMVAGTVGRLLRLQGSVTTSQVVRRMTEELGQRETVSRATQRILRCMVDWEVLSDTSERGVYKANTIRTISDQKVIAWLLEATLIANDAESSLIRTLAQAPALFPFVVEQPNLRNLESSQRLELFRQGLNQDVVVLCGTR